MPVESRTRTELFALIQLEDLKKKTLKSYWLNLKMVLRLVCLCLMIGVASAATFSSKLPDKPAELAHKKGCYIKEVKDVIPYGTMITPIGHCLRIECEARAIYYASCGAISTNDPKCHKTAMDTTKPYPECCPTFKCEDENRV